jgi:hypothetical protein
VESLSGTAGEQAVNSSEPVASAGPGNAPDAWFVFVDNTSATAQTFVVFAVCAPAGQVTTNFKAKGLPAKK